MSSAIAQLTRDKLVKVLGADKAERVAREVLDEIGLPELATADDLLRFARALEKRGGFESALGAMLSVQAVLRGARNA